VIASEPSQLRRIDLLDHHAPAARLERFEQPRQVVAHVDQEVRPGEVAAKPQRGPLEIEVDAEHLGVRGVPVRDTQGAIAFPRVAAERCGVEQAACANRIRGVAPVARIR
jgi:hypothetical protein